MGLFGAGTRVALSWLCVIGFHGPVGNDKTMNSDDSSIKRVGEHEMGRSKKVVSMMVVTAVLGTTGVGWAGDKVSFEVTADFFSKYVWRGQNLVDGAVFQPGVSVGYKGLTASVWGNLDITNKNDNSGNFTEVDYALDYSGTVPGVEKLGYSVGAVYYDFPNTGVHHTTELYLGFSLDVPASPSVTVYRDIDQADGTYVALGVGHSIEEIASLPFGVDLSANLGWGDSNYNDAYWGTAGSELNDLTLSVGFPFSVGPVSVVPSVTYVKLLGSNIKDVADDDSLFYAGVGLAYEF